MFFSHDEVKVTPMGEGMERRVLAHDGSLMMVEMAVAKKGSSIPQHSHPHEQITYIVEGEVEFILNGNSIHMKKGDSIYCAPDSPHYFITSVDGTVAMDVFTPQREDFK